MSTITNYKLVGVEIRFHFTYGITADNLAKIKRKVQRMTEEFDYSVNAMYFTSRNDIRVVVGFEVEDFNSLTTYDEFNKSLERLIDSHSPEVATYKFSDLES